MAEGPASGKRPRGEAAGINVGGLEVGHSGPVSIGPLSSNPQSSNPSSNPQSSNPSKGWTPPPFSIRAPSDEPSVDLTSVLHGEEVTRAKVFFRLILGIAILTGAFIPLLAGPLWLRVLAAALCGGAAMLCGVVLLTLRRRERYTGRVAAAVGIACALLGVTVIYYIGIFSAAAMILVVGLYFFGTSHSRLAARSTYATMAVAYFIASAGIAAGVLEDRSLFSTENAADFTRWFQVFMSQVVLALTFYLARSSRRATEGAIDRVNQAKLDVTRRDAQLAEARSDLARVLRPTDGRFTGARLGEFAVGDIIGRGAMGEVYRGTDGATLPVAIKLLHMNMVENPDKLKRFMREAEAAAAVDSAHVPRMYGSGWSEDGTTPYLVMELLEGHDLGWHLRKTGKLNTKLVVEMVEHVAKALAHVRDAGVVHRDLKPANLFLTDSLPRTWKVLDFGLSKLVWESGSLTRDAAVGTPSYMSPEQVRGPSVDHQADLYALTAIAYRALTGIPPFSGNEIAHVLYRVCYQQPVCPGDLVQLPIEVELVLAIGMAKRREDRFAKVEDLANAMRDAFEGKLDDETRARGWALIKRYPWGSSMRPMAKDDPSEAA